MRDEELWELAARSMNTRTLSMHLRMVEVDHGLSSQGGHTNGITWYTTVRDGLRDQAWDRASSKLWHTPAAPSFLLPGRAPPCWDTAVDLSAHLLRDVCDDSTFWLLQTFM